MGVLQNGTFVFWCAVTLIVIVPVLAYYWWRARKDDVEAALKRDMIDRGMSAEDIERVFKAKSDDE